MSAGWPSSGCTPRGGRPRAGYLKTSKPTVYRALKRWIEERIEGLEDRPKGWPAGVRKVDLRAIEAVRRLQENPNLGAFRVHAALQQMG